MADLETSLLGLNNLNPSLPSNKFGLKQVTDQDGRTYSFSSLKNAQTNIEAHLSTKRLMDPGRITHLFKGGEMLVNPAFILEELQTLAIADSQGSAARCDTNTLYQNVKHMAVFN